MIEIERHETLHEATKFNEAYVEARIRIKNPHKNYEVSLMRNKWMKYEYNDADNYREVATIDKEDDDYIQDGQRWNIHEHEAKDILMACVKAYVQFDDKDDFHQHMFTALEVA